MRQFKPAIALVILLTVGMTVRAIASVSRERVRQFLPGRGDEELAPES